MCSLSGHILMVSKIARSAVGIMVIGLWSDFLNFVLGYITFAQPFSNLRKYSQVIRYSKYAHTM